MRHGATILDAEGLRLTPDESAFFRDADPFGFILFGRNLADADQIRALCGDLRMSVGRQAPILIDQEGGRVQRLRPPLARDWPAPLDHAMATGDAAARVFYLRYRLIAEDLRGLGIDVNCAPSADLALPETHPFLRNRCYGSDPKKVAELARAAAKGLADGGVLPVMKHMPGHGRSMQDSHHDLPHVPADLDTLRETDFAPFSALADLPMGMTCHLVYDAIDPNPASHSAKVIGMIRDDIGFDGLLMTDDLSMQALSGTPAARCRAALDAGCDIALYCNAPLADRIAVAEAAGQMTAAATRRADAALAARRAPQPLDIIAAEAELAGAAHV